MTETMVLRAAEDRDIESMRQLETASEGAPHWSPENYRSLVQAGTTAVFEVDGEVIGFAGGRVTLSGLEAEIETIVVSKDFRRQGLGRRLCQWLVHQMDASEVRLEARESNHAALELYRSMGFCIIGRRSGYYAQPVEDALILLLKQPL